MTDVPLCTRGRRLASNAEIQLVMKQRRDNCLLLDAIERYHSAVQLTSPTVSTQKSHVVVSKVGAIMFSCLGTGSPTFLPHAPFSPYMSESHYPLYKMTQKMHSK